MSIVCNVIVFVLISVRNANIVEVLMFYVFATCAGITTASEFAFLEPT